MKSINQYKAIIFDFDGVVSKHNGYYSSYFVEKNNYNSKYLNNFFEGVFQECLIGKRDLKQELMSVLEKYNTSPEEYMNDWFEYDIHIDSKVTNLITDLKKQGVKCVLGTNQEKYRTQHITDILRSGGLFDTIYSSSGLGFLKPQQEFFTAIFKDLSTENIGKNEILFIDDDIDNIKAGEKFGFDVLYYKNFTDIISS